jgi:hypothetical protein
MGTEVLNMALVGIEGLGEQVTDTCMLCPVDCSLEKRSPDGNSLVGRPRLTAPSSSPLLVAMRTGDV